MTDRDTYGGDWIAAWIAQQREDLQRRTTSSQDAKAAGDFANPWAEAGKFFEGFRESTLKTGAAIDPFNIGDALLGAWTSATMIQSGVAEHFADLLGRLPPLGLAREQTEAWRELAAVQAECKRLEHELRTVLAKVHLDALDLLEKRVNERAAEAPIDSFRALYDLWVECGEQVFGKLAHSAAYSKLQAELGNASMRLRSRVQAVLEHALKQFDLPTRSELNSLHRQVRELRLQIEQLEKARPQRKPARAKQPAAPKSGKTKAKTKARAR
jgi:class III poly(R)-hydroxyalkanoic acid synthase PhaE subunit